jgi:hypothetical protein
MYCLSNSGCSCSTRIIDSASSCDRDIVTYNKNTCSQLSFNNFQGSVTTRNIQPKNICNWILDFRSTKETESSIKFQTDITISLKVMSYNSNNHNQSIQIFSISNENTTTLFLNGNYFEIIVLSLSSAPGSIYLYWNQADSSNLSGFMLGIIVFSVALFFIILLFLAYWIKKKYTASRIYHHVSQSAEHSFSSNLDATSPVRIYLKRSELSPCAICFEE